MAEKRLSSTLTTLVVFLLAGVGHAIYSTCVGEFGNDGGYYTDIARNVRDGFGLTTDVSVFHQGFRYFPHPTPVYPVWPLVYGYVARLAPLEIVGVWLPTALFYVVLVLGFLLGRRANPQPLLPKVLPAFHAGHVWVLVLGTGFEMVRWTAGPYTEALAFTLLFVFLLRARALWRRLGALAGLELGLWLILLFLVRSQFLVVAIAAVAASPLALWHRPRAALPALLAGVATFVAGWSLYSRWLGTFLIDASLGTYLRFDSTRATEGLSRIPVMYKTGGPLERALDLLRGVQVAFSQWDTQMTYYGMHHAFSHALVPAALLLAWQGWRKRAILRRFGRRPEAGFAAFFFLASAALIASLHTVHKVYGTAWVFGERQALPSVLAVTGCLVALLRSRAPLMRAIGVFVLCTGTFTALRSLGLETDERCEDHAEEPPRDAYRAELRAWLLARREELGSLTVVVERPEAQRLSWRTPGVGFHWITQATTVDDVTALVRDFGAQYVLDFDTLPNTTYKGALEFPERFVLYAVLSELEPTLPPTALRTYDRERYVRIYAPRCSAFPTPPPTCIEVSPVPEELLPETYAALPVGADPDVRLPRKEAGTKDGDGL